jgi:NADPH:quinone reductase-like Zn-dependent oxidoreductase
MNPYMRAVRMHGYGGPDVLRMDTVPLPEPDEKQVRVRIHAVGINPFEWKLREGRMRERIDLRLPHIPGFDVAGVIDKAGSNAGDWKEGDAVVAALHRAPLGGYAEYAVVSIEDIAGKPEKLSFEEAAGLPTPATTAWRFLMELAGLKSHQRVFIHGGAGGVGSAAVQIAKAHGAYVIATASSHNSEYLRAIGADQWINYRLERFEDHIREADMVLDTVGGETLERSPLAMRMGAVLVSTAGQPSAESCASARIQCPPPAWPATHEFGARLREITSLVDAGKFRVNLDKVFPLAQAATAQELNRQGHTRGKIVLRVRSEL